MTWEEYGTLAKVLGIGAFIRRPGKEEDNSYALVIERADGGIVEIDEDAIIEYDNHEDHQNSEHRRVILIRPQQRDRFTVEGDEITENVPIIKKLGINSNHERIPGWN